MAYNPNIPQPNDQISQSQDDILQNFQALNPAYINSLPYVLLNDQALSPATSATQVALYAKTSTGDQLFFRRESNGQEIPFTQKGIRLDGGPSDNRHVWSYLPSGILTMSGSVVSGASGAATVTFAAVASFPGFNAAFFPIVTATLFSGIAGSNSTVRVTALGTASVSFQALINTTGTAGIPILYTATGYL